MNNEILNNDLYPVTPFDRAYAALLNDIIASRSMKRLAAKRLLLRHLEWIEFRRSAASCDKELNESLFEVSYFIDSYAGDVGIFADDLSAWIPEMPASVQESFAVLFNYDRLRHAELEGNLWNLGENFVSGREAYTDDCSDPEHTAIQKIIEECGGLDQYHAIQIYELMHKVKKEFRNAMQHELRITFLKHVLAIAKALPRYRGHARVQS